MTYRETLDYLFSQLPMYQRVGSAAYKADLQTTWDLLAALGNPQECEVKYIHVAGTNGKGSVTHMVASILQEQGYKTGLFTSPHLLDFRERVRINGQPISESAVIDFVETNRNIFSKLNPSFFEMTAALAFTAFKSEKVDFAVLETGMGGRLDSTNVIVPEVSVITNIGFDHTQFLGNTIEKIALEKAGIIKLKRPVVTGPMLSEALKTINSRADEMNAPHFPADDHNTSYTSDLKGVYQSENISTVLKTIEVLRSRGVKIEEESLHAGLNKVVSNTGLLGRWQTLSENPKTICDVGHNADGIRVVLKQLSTIPYRELHVVFGMVNDKDSTTILSLMPKSAQYYFCAANIPRALPAAHLAGLANEAGLRGDVYQTVRAAIEAARSTAKESDLVFIGGSIFIVAEALELFT